MINIRMHSNLPQVLDSINMIPIDISQILAKSIQSGAEEIRINMGDLFEDSDGYVNINLNFSSGEYQIIIDDIDNTSSKSKLDDDYDNLLNQIEEIVINEMRRNYTEGGYIWQ